MDRKKRDITKHKCGESKCLSCSEFVMPDHKCYYRITSPAKTSGRFLFYDYETSQDEIHTCDAGYKAKPRVRCADCTHDHLYAPCRRCVNCKKSYCSQERHLPVYLVCQTACDLCKDDTFHPKSKCSFCGDRCNQCNKRKANV